jgi:hypothetical protein
LAIRIVEVLLGCVGNGSGPELEVLKEKVKGGKHAITFGTERAWVAAVGASTALPKHCRVGGNDPAKGAAVGSTAIMGEVERRGGGILEVCRQVVGMAVRHMILE